MTDRPATLAVLDDDGALVVTPGGEAVRFPRGSDRFPGDIPVGTSGVLRPYPLSFGETVEFIPDCEVHTLAQHPVAIPLYPVTVSSNIAGLGYSDTYRVLVVRFKNGGVYEYDRVTQAEWRALCRADSFGKALNADIKPTHPFRRIA